VIVFDRIRENLAQKKKGESLTDMTTRAIQETITRSIYTVLTVLITLAAMLIWGGGAIRDFAMSLFIGIASGMYSSIFIAAALWLMWQKSENDRKRLAPGSKPVRA
jgi:preprotein translocase subunit SecF